MAKVKYTLEYDMKSTPVAMLWSYLTTPNGLKEWFADNVKQSGKELILDWNGAEQSIVVAGIRTEKYVRYHWKEDEDKTYFEMKILVSELTGSTVLIITDYADSEEVEEAKDLWNYQIEILQRLLGC